MSAMADDPVRFTDEQRELFQRVATIIRSAPSRTAEAGRWLDSGAGLPALEERVKRTRDYWLAEIRSRRQVGRKMGRESGRQYLVPLEGPTLGISRVILAGRIRDARAEAVSQPNRYDIIEAAAQAVLTDPPNYDALRPDIAERNAWRVLLVVWILTDSHPLATGPKMSELQEWEWGEHQLEFLDGWPEDLIRMKGDRPFALAGLWERWRPEASAEPLNSFTVLTTSPNELLAPIHNRMPVIVAPRDFDRWLDPGTDPAEVAGLLKPTPPGRWRRSRWARASTARRTTTPPASSRQPTQTIEVLAPRCPQRFTVPTCPQGIASPPQDSPALASGHRRASWSGDRVAVPLGRGRRFFSPAT